MPNRLLLKNSSLFVYGQCTALAGFDEFALLPTILNMLSLSQQRTQKYISARQQHPAWVLLASRRAPLVLSCLDALFEHQRDGVPFDAATQALADMLASHANDTDFEIDSADTLGDARREIREWIRRGLVVEREGRIFETDALKTALSFLTQLDGRMMTSTASRLAVVQREIDNLAAALNPIRKAASRTCNGAWMICSSNWMPHLQAILQS